MGDGSLMDLHRYALDAVAFDYIMVGDHNMGQDNEYCWWQTQHANDLYTVPGAFISMYGYERSVPYPNGHRNVIWTTRGHRTLPLPKPVAGAMQKDTDQAVRLPPPNRRHLHAAHVGHQPGHRLGSTPHDPALEPFVELFQGYHTSYEAPGAPKVITSKTERIHGKYEAAGFVSNALAKGYKLGFQASSDHISTHVSYACILAEEFSRKGIVEAMKKRHTYAATDNIILDVRCGSGDHGRRGAHGKPAFRRDRARHRPRSPRSRCCATAGWSTPPSPRKRGRIALRVGGRRSTRGGEGELLLRPRDTDQWPDGVVVADLGEQIGKAPGPPGSFPNSVWERALGKLRFPSRVVPRETEFSYTGRSLLIKVVRSRSLTHGWLLIICCLPL